MAISMSDDDEPRPVVRLRLDFGRARGFLPPEKGAALRDELLTINDPAAARLAEQLDTVVTLLLAAPDHAGTRGLRIAADEHAILIEALNMLEADPGDDFANARRELCA